MSIRDDSAGFFFAVFFSFPIYCDLSLSHLRSSIYNSVNSATDCADVCVKAPESSVVTGGRFRGFEYICSAKQCRCLYDAGTLNSNKKTSSYDRTKTNQSGKGSINNSQEKTDYYCAKLVGSALELAVE